MPPDDIYNMARELVHRVPFLLCHIAALVAIIIGRRRLRWRVLTVMAVAAGCHVAAVVVGEVLDVWYLHRLTIATVYGATTPTGRLLEHLYTVVEYLPVLSAGTVAVCLLIVVARLIYPPQAPARPPTLPPIPIG